MLPLHLEETWEAGAETHRVRLGRMNPGDQRLGDAIEHLATETPGHERFETLVLDAVGSGEDQIGHGASPTCPGEKWRTKEGANP
jgi:hypothetical protein